MSLSAHTLLDTCRTCATPLYGDTFCKQCGQCFTCHELTRCSYIPDRPIVPNYGRKFLKLPTSIDEDVDAGRGGRLNPGDNDGEERERDDGS